MNLKKWKGLILMLAILSSCGQKDEAVSYGEIAFYFQHKVNGEGLVVDEMIYTNAAGNKYEVNEIQWFVSDITLHETDGDSILLNPDHFAHYIDTDLPKTHYRIIDQKVPAETYKAISFTFGIKGIKNIPFRFTDPPESDMIWPINLGGEQGGYHYMKLNGFITNPDNERQPFNFHLGVGQEKNDEGVISGFIQNWVNVELPKSGFQLKKGEKILLAIDMNVDRWFANPHTYDHNIIGGKIMQNQEAMRMAVENGKTDVFTLESKRVIKSFDAFE